MSTVLYIKKINETKSTKIVDTFIHLNSESEIKEHDEKIMQKSTQMFDIYPIKAINAINDFEWGLLTI